MVGPGGKRRHPVGRAPLTFREWHIRKMKNRLPMKKSHIGFLGRDSDRLRSGQLYHTFAALSIGKINKIFKRFLCKLYKNKIRQNIQKRKCIFMHFLQFYNISFSNNYLNRLRLFMADKPIISNKYTYIFFLPLGSVSVLVSQCIIF